MGQITANPTISLQQNIGSPLLLYLADGVAIFGCVGNPEGVIAANKRSLALSDNGNIYFKTTDLLATGWVASGGGGGTGTVTSVGMTVPGVIFNSPVSGSPVTTSGSFALALATQSANKVFAGPSSGVPATPTFRSLTVNDLSLAAALPAGGVQFNDGTNAFAASNGFKFDSASNTVQVGESTVLKGTLQLFAALSAGSVKHTVNNPGGNYVYIWGDSLPANNDLLKVTVSGSNVTIASIAASALGFPSINATDGVIPYRSSSTAFSDSPIARVSATTISLPASNTATAPSIQTASNGNLDLQGTGSGNGVILGGNNANSFYCNSTGFYIRSDGTMGWANGTTIPSSADTGFARRTAAVVRVTNGGTGFGQLLLGNSSATAIGQLHSIASATGVEAGYFEAQSSATVPTIRGVVSSIQSFAFNANGKLQGGCNIPTSNQQFSTIGNLKSDVSELGNVGAGATNLLSFTVVANAIVNNGDTVQFITTVVYAANANNKQVECTFGGVSVFLISDLYSGSQGEIRVRIKRTGATTAKVIATYVASDVLLRSDCQYNEISVTWSSNNTFQVKGTATSNNDIINKELESNVIIAQTS